MKSRMMDGTSAAVLIATLPVAPPGSDEVFVKVADIVAIEPGHVHSWLHLCGGQTIACLDSAAEIADLIWRRQ